jgi:hypothetical protein
MFISTTPQAIIDDVNALTDNDGYSLFSVAQLVAWMNNELTTAWQWMRRCNRDVFTKCSASITMPSTGIMSMTAALPTGAGITDWSSARGVDVSPSTGYWKKVRLWNFVTRDRIFTLSYRFIGDTLYMLPVDVSSQYPVRVWYQYSAPVVVAPAGVLTNTALSLPDGVDEYIKQGMAIKARVKLDDDPTPHMQAQGAAKLQVEAFLAASKGDQGSIADVSEDYGPEIY